MNSFLRSKSSSHLNTTHLPEHSLIKALQEIFRARGSLSPKAVWSDAHPLPWKSKLVTSVDCGIAGVHFPYPFLSPTVAFGSGYRTLMACVSDLASQGAKPLVFLLSLTLDGIRKPMLLKFLTGMATAAAHARIQLLGGNISTGAQFSAHCTVFGSVRGTLYPRGRVEPGDDLWITGTQGDAILGLILFRSGSSPHSNKVRPYFFPAPRIRWGNKLHGERWLKGMVDISDGWLRDLYNLVFPAGLGIAVDPSQIPRSLRWKSHFLRLKDPEERSLLYWGGDDYELAFATARKAREKVKEFLKKNRISAVRVGEVIPSAGIRFLTPPEVRVPPQLGYDALRPKAVQGRIR